MTAMTTTPVVSRWESNTARFGRVITYRVELDGVTFKAERMVGLSEDYTVYAHVGLCGVSHVSNLARVSGGRGVADRFLTIAQQLREDPSTFIKPDEPGKRTHAEMCCDRPACGRFRPDLAAAVA